MTSNEPDEPIDGRTRSDHVLSGVSAVITGAAQGIGYAIADALMTAGAGVLLTDVNAEQLDRATASLRHRGGGAVEAMVADVTDLSQLQHAARHAEQHLGPLQVWVNNAAIVYRGPVASVTPDERERMMSVNVTGTLNGCLAAYEIMAVAGRGSIVNLSSQNAVRAYPDRTDYGTTKATVAALTRNLAYEWGPSGIRVNAVAPGYIATELTRWLTEDPARRIEIERQIPLRRIGTPQDVAQAVVALSSGLLDYVTGQVLSIDGGTVL